MILNAVAVVSKNISKSVEFYKLLGFTFPEFSKDEQHIESIVTGGGTKLMIDSYDLIKDILKTDPVPSNHSSFAVMYDSPKEVDGVAAKLKDAGYTLVVEPWDAFWGQRYSIAEDPFGYKVDLYAYLS